MHQVEVVFFFNSNLLQVPTEKIVVLCRCPCAFFLYTGNHLHIQSASTVHAGQNCLLWQSVIGVFNLLETESYQNGLQKCVDGAANNIEFT